MKNFYKIFLATVFTLCFYHVDAGVTVEPSRYGGTTPVRMKHYSNKEYTDTYYTHYTDEHTTEIYGSGSTPIMPYDEALIKISYDQPGCYYKFYDYRTDNPLRTWRTEKIIVGEGITELGEYAFCGIEKVEEISLPSTLTTIGSFAFYECCNLKSLTIPKNVTHLHTRALDFGKGDPIDPILLERIINLSTVPQEMQSGGSLGDNLDFNNVLLYVPTESVNKYKTADGWKRFKNILGLDKLKVDKINIVGGESINLMIGKTIKLEVETTPFGLETVLEWSTDKPNILEVGQDGSITALKTGSARVSVNTVDGETYDVITVETYPDQNNLISAGDDVKFVPSSNNETLTLYGKGNTHNFLQGKTPWYADRSKYKKIIVSDGITSLGDYIFHELTSVEEVELPSTLQYIGESAFEACYSLKEVTIHEGVHTIKNGAFYNNTSLTAITLPYSLNAIEDDVFGECVVLENIILPQNVKSLGERVFTNTKKLKSILFLPNTPPVATKTTFDQTRVNHVKLICKRNVFYQYEKKDWWAQFVNREVTDDYTGIKSIEGKSVIVKDDVLYVNTPSNETVKVYNLQGKLLSSTYKQTGEVRIQLTQKGIFVVRGGSGWSEKFVK